MIIKVTYLFSVNRRHCIDPLHNRFCFLVPGDVISALRYGYNSLGK